MPRSTSPDTERLRLTIFEELTRAWARTAALTESLLDVELGQQPHRSLPTLSWHLGHLGNHEDIWLVRRAGNLPAVDDRFDDVYNPLRHPPGGPPPETLLPPGDTRGYLAAVRERVIDVLDAVEFGGDELLADGLVFGMVVQHEQHHHELMLTHHQLRHGRPVLAGRPAPASRGPVPGAVVVPGGPFLMGTSTHPWAHGRERPAHRVQVPTFVIDRAPVTNAQFLMFVRGGGYQQPQWWSEAGWRFRCRSGLTAPPHWRHDGDARLVHRLGTYQPLSPEEPVLHVSYYEAEAYAAWSGGRLPTEQEWEKAARWDPDTGDTRSYPWGEAPPDPQHANVGQHHLGPAPVGAYPTGASPLGVHQLIGDVWEWTSSPPRRYPDVPALPYATHDLPVIGHGHRVLRGGSFATGTAAARATSRVWAPPTSRHHFTGLRCVRDVRP